jgi:putative FmdB family regulatory protein
MPIYEYECKVCGIHFDRKQRWHDEPVKTCPECNGEVRKVLQPVGIVFKGSGFYKTDYSSSGGWQERSDKKDDDKSSAASDSKPTETTKDKPARSESASEGKAETKPLAKADK